MQGRKHVKHFHSVSKTFFAKARTLTLRNIHHSSCPHAPMKIVSVLRKEEKRSTLFEMEGNYEFPYNLPHYKPTMNTNSHIVCK